MRLVSDLGLQPEQVSGRRVGGNDERREPVQLGAKSRGELMPFIGGARLAAERAELHAVTAGG